MSMIIFQHPDGADNLLSTERLTLQRLKRTLEGELRAAQKQLQVNKTGLIIAKDIGQKISSLF